MPIHICPKCKCNGVGEVAVVVRCGMSKTWHEVKCTNCGYASRRSATEFSAIIDWNQQAAPVLEKAVETWTALENADIWY